MNETPLSCPIQDAAMVECDGCGFVDACHRYTSTDEWLCYSCVQKAVAVWRSCQ